MSQVLQESEALRPQPEEQPVLAAESLEPLDLSFVEELRRAPSDRDRRIHSEIDGEQRDPADVAAAFDLAEGTVRNIVQRVRRWKLETHDLIDMSSLDMLLVHYDQLKWQSRQLRLAWEYSAATREFLDKTISTRPGDPDQSHERVQVRRVESRGPNERYMRLHDHVREKMLKVGREVQELKARTAVVAGSPDPATAPLWSPTTPTPQAAKGARSETAARACCGQETAAEQGETAAEQGAETAAELAQPADVFARMKARLDEAAAEVKQMQQQNPSPLGTKNVEYTQDGDGAWTVRAVKRPKSKQRLSKREKRLLKQAKDLRKAERLAGDTTGHSQNSVMAAPQAAAGSAVTPSQVE